MVGYLSSKRSSDTQRWRASRIALAFCTKDDELAKALDEWSEYIRAETLADSLERCDSGEESALSEAIGSLDAEGHPPKIVQIGGAKIAFGLNRVVSLL